MTAGTIIFLCLFGTLLIWGVLRTIRQGIRSEFVRDMPLRRVGIFLFLLGLVGWIGDLFRGEFILEKVTGGIVSYFVLLLGWMSLWLAGFVFGRWKRERGILRSR